MDRPDPRVFSDPIWPEAFRADLYDGVERGFERAHDVLAPQTLRNPSTAAQKRDALEQIAHQTGRNFRSPELTIDFQGGVTPYGVMREACNLCGQCSSGCNRGSKGTLSQHYLMSAYQKGAHLFTQLDVRWIERVGDRWIVYFHCPTLKRDLYSKTPLWVSTDLLILSAGTLGSCEILLRSREKGLSLSAEVGKGVSRNGSRLEFSYHTDESKGCALKPKDTPERVLGPSIVSTLDLRDTSDVNEGIVVQDGVSPSWSHGILSWMLPYYSKKQSSGFQFLKQFKNSAREEGFSHTQNFLMIGHDDACGRVILKDDRPLFSWGQTKVFTEKLTPELELKTMNQRLGGQHVQLPFSVSVHPLGGCCMADSAESGVVSHTGEVFSGSKGKGVHPQLYVMDGSVIPRSLGINPLWSITAIAERNVALLIERWRTDHSQKVSGLQIQESSYELGNHESESFSQNKRQKQKIYPSQAELTSHHSCDSSCDSLCSNLHFSGLHFEPKVIFTERLKGVMSWSQEGELLQRRRPGYRESSVEMMVTLYAQDEWSAKGGCNAQLFGGVEIPELSDYPLRIEDGRAQLFKKNPHKVNAAEFIQEGRLVDVYGQVYFFRGRKDLCSSRGGLREFWKDTTELEWFLSFCPSSLHPSSLKGFSEGQGVLRVHLKDVLKMAVSAHVPDASSLVSSIHAQSKWAWQWGSPLKKIYLPLPVKDLRGDPERVNQERRLLRAPTPQEYLVQTADCCELKLIRFQGGQGTPILLLHGYSANEYSFMLDTIEMNLVEYLTQLGRDVWIGCWRSNGLLSSAKDSFTLDDVARFDHPALLSQVIKVSGQPQVDVIAHCVGSLTLLMSLLGGWSKHQVRSILATQVGIYWDAPTLLEWKARSGLPQLLETLGIHSLPVTSRSEDPTFLKRIDQLLHLHPQQKDVICRNPTCRRTAFLFGPIFNHDKLNEETHRDLGRQFGFASVHAFRQLARIVQRKEAVTWSGESYLKQNLDALKIPITFLRGSENRFIGESSTKKTYQFLRKRFPKEFYRHLTLDGYGHGDIYIGKDVAHEVFPVFQEHLQWVENQWSSHSAFTSQK